MTQKELEKLRLKIFKAGGVSKVAEDIGMNRTSISKAYNGHWKPPKKLLDYIGMEAVVTIRYREKREEAKQ